MFVVVLVRFLGVVIVLLVVVKKLVSCVSDSGVVGWESISTA